MDHQSSTKVVVDFRKDGNSSFGPAPGPYTSSVDTESLLQPGGRCTVTSALGALAASPRPMASLALHHLSSPVPEPDPATLSYLRTCGLEQLELHDVSTERSAAEGASNLLRAPPPARSVVPSVFPMDLPVLATSLADSLRSRGSAMIRLALELPSLKRLSLCNAAFSAADVAALSALTQVEELTITGAMECGTENDPDTPSSPAEAAAYVYQRLLAMLPRLRRLTLPMAVPASSRIATYFDSDSDDEDMTTSSPAGLRPSSWGMVEPATAAAAGTPRFCASYCSGTTTTSSSSCCGSDLSDAMGGGYTGRAGRDGLSSDSFDGIAASLRVAGHCPPYREAPVEVPFRASAGSDGRGGWSAAPPAWSFPPHLEELTIPLCALNAPLFHAVCETFGGGGGRDGCSLRGLHVPCAQGYTVWEGSFLRSEADFRALSRLTSLETLHLSLELGGSGRGALRRSNLRARLQHLKALSQLKDLRISETRQPVCFSTRKRDPTEASLLSYLLDEDDDTPALPGHVLRLPAMPRLGERPQYTPYTVSRSLFSPPLSSHPHLRLAPASAPPPAPSASAVNALLSHWPQLQTLVVAGHIAVRSGSLGGPDRLVLRSGGAGSLLGNGFPGLVGDGDGAGSPTHRQWQPPSQPDNGESGAQQFGWVTLHA